MYKSAAKGEGGINVWTALSPVEGGEKSAGDGQPKDEEGSRKAKWRRFGAEDEGSASQGQGRIA